MPDENGLDLIPRIRKIRPDLRVVVMSAQSTLMTAVKATQRGAFEYLPKPFDLQELLSVVGRALSVPTEAFVTASEPRDADERLPLIGRSPAMQEIYRTIARLTTTDLTVMINGESGTGKELVARALHDYGKRRAGPFVAINMAAIPRELIESELFGHERGAFTGATTRTQGRFEQANGGTLFLDEIGDMPPEAQTRLLRVLQEGEFTVTCEMRSVRASFARICSTGSMSCRFACHPFANGWRTFRCWRGTSWSAHATMACPARRSIRAPSSSSSGMAGRVMFANWKT
jgi:two-component system, NtrC family, nitrogen regulation response regulator GlnG